MTEQKFAENLRLICGFEKSVSAVCRGIGINRQQFSKYLKGTSRPSPNNLRKICAYFALELSDLYLPRDAFADRIRFRSRHQPRSDTDAGNAPLLDAFPGDLARLRRYLGYYLTYCHSFSWQDRIVCGATHVFEAGGIVRTKALERIHDPGDGTFYLSKYSGQLALLGNRIFSVEFQSLERDAIVETVLYPVGRAQLTLLRGITFGMSNTQRHPFVSRSVWKFLGTNVDLRAFIGASGLFPASSAKIDPKVRKILGERQFPSHMLHYHLEPYGVG